MEKFSASIEGKKKFVSQRKSEEPDAERIEYSFNVAVYDENHTRIGAVSLEHLKGMNLSERIGEVFYIKEIEVTQSQRGKGNGSEIIEGINRFLISRGNAIGVLNDGIMKRNAERALYGLYERHGWKDIKSDRRLLEIGKKFSGLDWRSKVDRFYGGNWKYFYQGKDIDDTEYERLCCDAFIGTGFFFREKDKSGTLMEKGIKQYES